MTSCGSPALPGRKKRLERGRFVWPRAEEGMMVLSRAQLSMRRCCSTTHRDALGADADLAGSEEVVVTDPRHPLYRRRFRLLSVV